MKGAVLGAAAACVVVLGLLAGTHAPRRLAPVAGLTPRRAAPSWVAETCAQLRWAGHPSAVWDAARTLCAALAIILLLTWGVAGLVLSACVAVGLPKAARRVVTRRRLDLRDRQVPDAMERVAAALRSGAAPGPALAEVAEGLDGPLGEELRSVVRGLDHGEPLAGVLERWAAQPGTSPAVVLAASALGLGAAAGGHVARAVDGVAATLRERRQLQGEVRALATQARTSARLLAAAPGAFAALVATVEPGILRFLLATPIGLVCLALGAALDALGLLWMGRIVRSAS